jgi:hypothetical protein
MGHGGFIPLDTIRIESHSLPPYAGAFLSVILAQAGIQTLPL